MLKVLQISNKAPYPANDGSSIAVFNMARGLIANDVDLYMVSINTKKHFKPDDAVPEAFRRRSHYASVYRNTNISVTGALLNLFTKRSYFVSRFHFGEFENKLVTLLKSHDFDIVQLEGLFMAVYIDVIRKHSRASIVLRAHNIEHYIWKRHLANEHNGLKKVYLSLQNRRLKRFELDVMNRVDAVVTITSADREAFITQGCTKPIFSCITGVDIREYQSPTQVAVKPGTVFSFGSMDWLPNQEAVKWFLDNCWEKVHQAVPEARLIIAGKGMPLAFYHITRPNVAIVENVENSGQFFRQHQVMVVPLRSGSGLRIKIIEGMAYGKAIVSTAVGAEGINYTHGHNIMVADGPDDFANAVITLLRDEGLRKQLASNAAAFAAAEFDNSVVVARLVEFYGALKHA